MSGWRGFPLSQKIVESAGDIAILGRKGMGKTTASKAIVERLVGAGRRVVVLDPMGHWWGLKLAADGLSPGLPVVVLGGRHGDISITHEMGRQLAELVIASEHSVIVDLADMPREGEMQTFAADFLSRLYDKDEAPLWLVLEEADTLAPQRIVIGEQRRVRSIVDTIARRGRGKGFRLISITQRAAVIDKNVLSMMAVMISFGMRGLQDRRTVRDWFEGAVENAPEVFETLSKLPVGEAWMWLPEHDRAVRAAFPMIETFNSSSTPMVGRARAPAALNPAQIDFLKETLKGLLSGDDMAARRKRLGATNSVVGRAVIKARERAGLSQTGLAKKIRSNQGWISRIESGGSNASLEMLERIGEACGLDLVVDYAARR